MRCQSLVCHRNLSKAASCSILTTPVSIECTKEGVKFSCQGDIGSGSVQLRQHTNVEKPGENVEIDLSEPVSLTFSLKYLVNFCKASGLSDNVKLSLSSEVPLLVEYSLSSNSYLRFYLAPKVSFLGHSNTSTLTDSGRSATRSKKYVVMSHVFLRFVWDYRRRTDYAGGTITVCMERDPVHVQRARVGELATHRLPQGFPRLCPTTRRPTSSRVEFQIRNNNTLPQYCHAQLNSPGSVTRAAPQLVIFENGLRRARTRDARAGDR